MSAGENEGDAVTSQPASVYDSLTSATPVERANLIRRLVAELGENPLVLPPMGNRPVVLDEIDLSRSATQVEPISLRKADLRGARLRHARLIRADLAGADLREAALGGADLRGANLEGADLRGADLAGAKLSRASLGGADFRGAMLEEADLREARLRFAQFGDAELEHADLRRADLWGAILTNTVLAGADLRRAILIEADLSGADLTGADLRRADCGRANFNTAILRSTKLQGLDLSGCILTGVHLGGVRLDETRFRREQLGEAIGEEIACKYEEAREGYLSLERAFADAGDHDSSVWAYLRRRRMQKHAALVRAKAARAARDSGAALRNYAQYGSNQFVEWICDYGESVPRILVSLLILYLIFTLAYGLTGSVSRETSTPGGPSQLVTHDLEDLAIFSLLAMSTGDTGDHLKPSHDLGRALVGLHVFLWVAVTGLLGFVLGNRIRR